MPLTSYLQLIPGLNGCQCGPAGACSPNPVQGNADDVQMSSRDESVIHNMNSSYSGQVWTSNTQTVLHSMRNEVVEIDGIKPSPISPLSSH